MKNGIYDFCDKADFLMILKGNSGHLRTSDFSKISSYLDFFRAARGSNTSGLPFFLKTLKTVVH